MNVQTYSFTIFFCKFIFNSPKSFSFSTTLLLLLFMIAFTWIGMMLLVILVTKLRCLEFKVQSSAAVRVVVIVTSVLFIYAVSQVGDHEFDADRNALM